jgi:hypothetical protein
MQEFDSMSRQQRRQLERQVKKMENRRGFTLQEVENMNAQAYELGKETSLEAAAQVLGLGEVRLDRVKKHLAKLEAERFGPYANIDSRGR